MTEASAPRRALRERRVVRLRATVGRIAANQVQQLRLVAALAERLRRGGPR